MDIQLIAAYICIGIQVTVAFIGIPLIATCIGIVAELVRHTYTN